MVVFNPLLEGYGVYAFPKGIISKVKLIAWLEFELAYYNATVKLFLYLC